ncbi:MAG TPA: hypothetical protein VMO88_15680 [Acidimicrobiales bacterium]|nr:hypothetical protein [Acidimicrobiales bacterium]
MGVGTSIVVFAIGAIMKFATNVHSSSFNIQTIGVILMAVGAVGFIVSLFFWGSWGGFGGGYRRRRAVYSDGGRYPSSVGGRTVVEEDDRARY